MFNNVFYDGLLSGLVQQGVVKTAKKPEISKGLDEAVQQIAPKLGPAIPQVSGLVESAGQRAEERYYRSGEKADVYNRGMSQVEGMRHSLTQKLTPKEKELDRRSIRMRSMMQQKVHALSEKRKAREKSSSSVDKDDPKYKKMVEKFKGKTKDPEAMAAKATNPPGKAGGKGMGEKPKTSAEKGDGMEFDDTALVDVITDAKLAGDFDLTDLAKIAVNKAKALGVLRKAVAPVAVGGGAYYTGKEMRKREEEAEAKERQREALRNRIMQMLAARQGMGGY